MIICYDGDGRCDGCKLCETDLNGTNTTITRELVQATLTEKPSSYFLRATWICVQMDSFTYVSNRAKTNWQRPRRKILVVSLGKLTLRDSGESSDHSLYKSPPAMTLAGILYRNFWFEPRRIPRSISSKQRWFCFTFAAGYHALWWRASLYWAGTSCD